MKKNRTNTTITKEFKIPSIADNEQLNSILYRGIKASPSRLFSWSGSKIPAVLTTYDHEFSIYQFKNPTTSLKRPTQESPFIATITGTKVLDIAASTVQMQKDTEYVKQTDIYRDQDSQVLGVEKLKKQGLDPFYDTTIINDEKIEKQWGSDYLKKKDIPRPVNDDYPTPEVEEPEVDYTRPTFEATYADEDPIPVSNPLPPLKKPVAVHDSLPTHEFFRIRAKENFDDSWIKERVEALDELFRQFNINANVIDYKKGPSVSLYEIQTQPNVKLNVFETMDKNIQAKLEAKTIRIQAPIPGKSTVGIEAENKVQEIVSFRSCIDDPLFDNPKKPLNCVLGVDFDNKNCFFDLEDAPHLLIAGSTGKGKSVCLNTIIVSLLLRNNPSEVRLILVDPKRVELSDYAEIPHLLTPIIYDTKDAVKALGWLVGEMNERYRLFQEHKVKKISEFNEKVNEDCSAESLPRIVLIIDELSNLMNESSTEIDYYMETLANKARACGIHMICATQRPTVKVINGNIKNNFPKRIAFAVPSATDSSTIIDSKDATTLVGKGDMLFKDDSELKRLQGAFIENADIRACMDYIRSISTPKYAFYASDLGSLTKTIDDEVYDAAIYVVSYNSASTNSLMIKFNWGFDKATRIMNVLEKEGIVGPLISNKAREVLVGLPEVKGILKHE